MVYKLRGEVSTNLFVLVAAHRGLLLTSQTVQSTTLLYSTERLNTDERNPSRATLFFFHVSCAINVTSSCDKPPQRKKFPGFFFFFSLYQFITCVPFLFLLLNYYFHILFPFILLFFFLLFFSLCDVSFILRAQRAV